MPEVAAQFEGRDRVSGRVVGLAAEPVQECEVAEHHRLSVLVGQFLEHGWLVPAYTFPANRTDLSALRIVVRNGFSHDLADLLLDDLARALSRLARLPAPQRGSDSGSFAHGT